MLLTALNSKKIMITGGMGFIGHNLVKALIDRFDCSVVIIDDCCNSSSDVLSDYMHKIVFFKTDVLNIDDYSEHMDDSDYIFHLACSPITVSGENPEHDLNVNALSTLRILNYLKDHNPDKLKRFVIASSSSVYGNMDGYDIPFNEEVSPKIVSNYAATKLLSEHYTMMYAEKYKIPVTILRYSNVYGYGQSFDKEHCGVLGRFIHRALTGDSLEVFGNGSQTRDYTFIDDAVNATILSSVSDVAMNEIFNISTGHEVSINTLISILKIHLPDLMVEEHPEREIDNIKRRAVSPEKAKQQLKWSPSVDIEAGIKLTVYWYKKYIDDHKN